MSRTPLLIALLAATACYDGLEVQTAEDSVTFDSAPSRVVVKVDVGQVMIFGEDRTSSRVVWRTTWSQREPRVDASIDGDELLVDARCPSQQQCSTDLILRVPTGVDVVLETDAGGLRAVAIDGLIELSTGAGEILVEGGSGELYANSDAGDLLIQDFSGTADLSSGAGTIDLERLTGDAVVHTDAGDINSVGLRLTTIDAHTDAGSIDLRLNAAIADVLAVSDAGAVFIAVPSGSYDLDLSSDAGLVQVDGLQDGGSVRIRAHSGAGAVSARGY